MFTGGTFNTQVTHRIKMRYVAGLTNKMRLVFGTRTFDILDIDNVEERNVEMILTCKEGKSKGS